MWGLFGAPIDKMTSNTKKLMTKSHKKSHQLNLDVNPTKLPQQNDTKQRSSGGSSLFNDKTQKSLFKINMLIKRFLFSYDPKKIDYINERIPDSNHSQNVINGSNYKW